MQHDQQTPVVATTKPLHPTQQQRKSRSGSAFWDSDRLRPLGWEKKPIGSDGQQRAEAINERLSSSGQDGQIERCRRRTAKALRCDRRPSSRIQISIYTVRSTEHSVSVYTIQEYTGDILAGHDLLGPRRLPTTLSLATFRVSSAGLCYLTPDTGDRPSRDFRPHRRQAEFVVVYYGVYLCTNCTPY
ncbi:hypothetical protein BO71DRAFT_12531 [Aspergillus ellipticus CBS 707.79]|uniref:Uncharacterized protein n=1 Tax=Aspergillus ellipticus CBS 707.79 TaxID=1448320 RepID=A0A319EPJ7_9EURO|nr:hypothetical protein BO71DRAFT_12531 [Aspergillus ellipticus CBS 707.79]